MTKPLAILAGIESNADALHAVLDELAERRIDDVRCLGNVVGLGPDPEECIDLVRSRCQVVVAGDAAHWMIVLGDCRMSSAAHSNVVYEWCHRLLRPGPTATESDRARWAWLAGLPHRVDEPGLTLAVGSARDRWDLVSVRSGEYEGATFLDEILAAGEVCQCLAGNGEPALLAGSSPTWYHVVPGLAVALGPGRSIVLPGWVGRASLDELWNTRPRQRHLHARYVTIENGAATWHEVPYDRDAFEAKVRRMDLPQRSVDRVLGIG